MTNILAIHRPASTIFEAAYTVTTDENRAFVDKINIANVSGVDANYSIAIVLSDETANEDNAQAWNVKIPSGAHRFILIGVPLNDFGERLMVKSSVANALTFTLIGDE